MNIFYKSVFSKNQNQNLLITKGDGAFYNSSFLDYFQKIGKIKNSFDLFTQKNQKRNQIRLKSARLVSNLENSLSMEYSLDNFHRSNQDTCLVHKPSVFEGQWVESGDLLADCSASLGGELALGQNILIAYMPWEGYNFEDAILISERLVYDDLYTSIHIERYEIEIRDTKLGNEEITREIPEVSEESIRHLHPSGIAKLGSWIQEGDILVGKVTPVSKKSQSNYQKLLYTILEKPVLPIRDSSLRAPKGIKAKVIGIQIFKTNKPSSSSFKKKDSSSFTLFKNSKNTLKNRQPINQLTKKNVSFDLASLTPFKKKQFKNVKSTNASPSIRLNINKKSFFSFSDFLNIYSSTEGNATQTLFYKNQIESFSYNKSNSISLVSLEKLKIESLYPQTSVTLNSFKQKKYPATSITQPNPTLSLFKKQSKPSINHPKINLKSFKREKGLLKGVSSIQIYLAEKRRIQVGDKMAGRHGNKGIISQILPIEDMPFLPDGTPLDMVLNPLGVPSRMNVGQIYECLLGLAGKHLGENFKVFPFDEIYGAEASRSFVYSKLYNARVKTSKNWLFNPNSPGKIRLYDGRNGETFDQPVTVGYAYMIRLVHMVDDKIHARSTGPYSLVTQQPLRGRSKQGGQRLGEMEVWALEGYGAAFTLLEMLTIKSDDMTGRMTLWSNLILNKEISIGTPESFKVLICELQALCLDIGLFRANSTNHSPF